MNNTIRGIENIVAKLWDENSVKEYRPIPFWSWNDRLDPEELKRQIIWMAQEGFGGYFMHARGGLETEYLSKEWFACIRACIRQGKQSGLQSWAYDENGWPSGFVGGKLLREERNHDQYLTHKIGAWDSYAMVSYRITEDRLIRITDGAEERGACLNLYAHPSPSTVDILNPAVVDMFLKETHQQYNEQLNDDFSGLTGFFTDEPQYFRWDTPYTAMLPRYFAEEYGLDILDGLGLLFLSKEGYRDFRYKYWKAMQSLLLKNFAQRVYAWCTEHGISLTGHYIEEAELKSQMLCCGGIMPFYEYETIPGIDYLYYGITTPNGPKQVSSVACQLGKKKVLTETFAGCGWNVSARQARSIAEAQYVGGVNLMCQHLLPYAERGQRKRDYPAHFSWANPWVRYGFKPFNDYFARLGCLLGESREVVSVGVFCPIRSLYFDYQRIEYGARYEINDHYNETLAKLTKMHIPYHILDETVLQKYGSVQNGCLRVGEYSYSTIIFPKTYTMDKETKVLLEKYADQQGSMLFLDEKPSYIEGTPWECPFESNISLEEIQNRQRYTVSDVHTSVRSTFREIGDQKFIYAVNCDLEKEATLQFFGDFSGFLLLDLETGKQTPMGTRLSFEPGASRVLFLTDSAIAREEEGENITLEAPFAVKECTDNYWTLDTVYYSLDGSTYSGPYSSMGLFQELLSKQIDAEILLQYRFRTEVLPERLFLLAEDMNTRWCRVNGHRISFDGISDFEKQLYRANIAPFVTIGENCVEFKIHFYQAQQVYDVLFGNATESLRNCLVYNTAVEACYLQGDFGIYAEGGFRRGKQENTYLADGFYMGERRGEVTEPVLEGYPFFAGRMVLEKTFTVEKVGKMRLNLPGSYGRCSLRINGKTVEMSYFAQCAEIGEYLKMGENVAEITLYSGNRNLLGPHHYAPAEEPIRTGPGTFELPGSWIEGKSEMERSSYSFVRFGLFSGK
ncbi:MAG: hypothetical protein E7461_04080 [Ruminococcaceae bacterium]|nr:hypothetical protein [Oscillospiraceae bacterium]